MRSSACCVIRLARSRCCSSACGIRTLLKSSQFPAYRSFERIGGAVSWSSPASATLPWRVPTTDRARSYANADAEPPAPPTARVVTAAPSDPPPLVCCRAATAVAPAAE